MVLLLLLFSVIVLCMFCVVVDRAVCFCSVISIYICIHVGVVVLLPALLILHVAVLV